MTAVARVAGVLGCLALMIMVLATLLAIGARYFAMTGFEWSYEVAGIAFIWVTFLGAILAEARRENAAFEILRDASPARLRLFLRQASDGVIGIIGIVLLVSSVAMLQRSAFVPTPLLRWPGFVSSAAAPALGAALCVIALIRLWPSRKRRA
jgi:TRAP-type C4-dicarboxylate transport system permease small subunit